MGNCVNVPESNNKSKSAKKREKRKLSFRQVYEPVFCETKPKTYAKIGNDEKLSVQGETISGIPIQVSGSNAIDGSTDCESNNEREPSWMRLLSQSKQMKVNNPENENLSIFGENWDPELFDQRVSLKPRLNGMENEDSVNQPPSKQRGGSNNWNNWTLPETFSILSRLKKPKIPMISSSILGFSQLQTDMDDRNEWFRNGELESPQLNANDYLIKGKQKPMADQVDDDENLDKSSSPRDMHESLDYKEGWLRYTMFLHQNKSDAIDFYSKFRNAKHVFLSLEAKTGCELRISKRLYVYRGKLVRTVVIDGPSRKHIIRCYTSLPDELTKFIILECERPSMIEPRPMLGAPEHAYGGIESLSVYRKPIAV